MYKLGKKIYYLPNDISFEIFSYLEESFLFDVLNINDNKKKNLLLNKYLYRLYKNKFQNLFFTNLTEMKMIDYLIQVFNNYITVNNCITNEKTRISILKNNCNILYQYLIKKQIDYYKYNINGEFINIENIFFPKKIIVKYENECIENNNYEILMFLLDELKLHDYDFIAEKVIHYNYLILYEFIDKNINNISKITINKILSEKHELFKKLLILKKFQLIKFLFSHIININNGSINQYIDESYYKIIFEEFGITKYSSGCYNYKDYFRIGKIVNSEKKLDSEQTINDFIEIINFLEEHKIYLSFNNFKMYLQYLYINKKNDITPQMCWYDWWDDYSNDDYTIVPSPEIKIIKLKLVEYLYNKYNSYFKLKKSDYYFIDLIDNKKYENIKHLFSLGYYFNDKTYEYILDNDFYVDIMNNLIKENIIKKDILFCKYYASKNNLNRLRILHSYKFIIDETIMNVAIYNLSINVIQYLYFELKIEISNKDYEILEYYSNSNNNYYVNKSNYILKMINEK